jgi:hypothetical protein
METKPSPSILARYSIGPGWVATQDAEPDDPYADFERELFRANDQETTSIDMRVTFNTEDGTASIRLSRHDDTGRELPILLACPVPWATALQMIGATPKPGVDVTEPYTVLGFDRATGNLFSRCVMAADGLKAFACAADSEGLEMVASIPGRMTEDDLLTFPGDSLVDSETIRDQPDVFGPVPEIDEDAQPATAMRP